jgi:hypothetical protein
VELSVIPPHKLARGLPQPLKNEGKFDVLTGINAPMSPKTAAKQIGLLPTEEILIRQGSWTCSTLHSYVPHYCPVIIQLF